MIKRSTRLLNVGLHGANLGTRFLFIFFLAKYLDPAAVGYYGLFAATVGYTLYFVGLDFYTYVTREILKTPPNKRGRLLKGHAALSALLYILFLPITYALLHLYSGWPDYLFFWFLPILLLEHFNQEMSRLLVALSEQIAASIVLFIRQGSWAMVMVGLMLWDSDSRQLSVVMILWTLAGIAAASAAIYKIRGLSMGGWRSSLDWHWIKRGVAVSTAFVIATLALRGIQTFDRYWIEALGGIEIVGAYVLFFGVTAALVAFLDAGVFAFTYPALIRLYQTQNVDAARAKVRQMLGAAIFLSFGFALISWVALPYLLRWIDKAAYTDAIHLYPWLLTATIVNVIGLVPHFALYARGCDKPIIYSHIAAMIGFVPVTWMLSVHFSVLAVPMGLIFSFGMILVWKTVVFWKLDQADKAFSIAQQTIST